MPILHKTDRRGWAQNLRTKRWRGDGYSQARRNMPWLPGEDVSLLKRYRALSEKRARWNRKFRRYARTDVLWILVQEHGRSHAAVLARLAILDASARYVAHLRKLKRKRTMVR